MGRGRAKAKQTKVARQLKYGVPTTDLEKLQAELAGGAIQDDDEPEDDWDEDPYAKYIEDDDEYDEDEDDTSGRR